MKKIFFLLIACCLTVSMQAQGTFGGGDGSELNPYLISSKADMEEFINSNATYVYHNTYFLLTQNLTGANDTITDDGRIRPFQGIFDGGGHEIAIKLTGESTNNVGLFSYIYKAKIKNLGITGYIFYNHRREGNIGSICAESQSSTISNCYSKVNIFSSNDNGNYLIVGGLSAKASYDNLIINCYNAGNIRIEDQSPVMIGAPAYLYAGGIVGMCNSGGEKNQIKNCYNIGEIFMPGSNDQNPSSVGGICGSSGNYTYNTFTAVENCFTAIEGNGIVNSMNAGIRYKIGRIVGEEDHPPLLSNNYAYDMTLVNGEAISNLDENGKDGKDIELEYLKNQSWLSSTLGWDFENVWKMSANGFPRLKMQEEEFVPIEDAIIVDINSISNVYTGQPQAPAVSTISRRTPVLEYKIKDAPEDTYAPEKPVNAGSYTLKATLLNSGLYAAASKEQDFNITPKEITVVANGGSSTYGDNPANPKFTATGLVEGETVDLLTGLNNNFALNAASDVGRYSLYVTGTLTNSNYFINERHDAYWDIYSKAITITANNITKNANELDGINFTYNINPPLINNDQMSGALVCNYEEREGVYTIHQGNLTAGANYTITYVPGTLTVITIEDAITIASIYLLYTGQPQTPTVSATSGRTPVLEYKIRDAPEDTYTSEKPVNAGDYTLKAILPNEGGYAAAGKEQDFNISPKAITVTVKIGSSTYGDNPANPKFTATGLVEGETVDLLTGLSNSFAINATTPSGIYPLYVIGTLTNSNYFINERHDAYWLVYSKPITITANNITKNANELDGINFTYNINPPLINNDQMSGALVCNYEEREGVYTIYQGSLTAGPNYTITYVPGTLTTTTASAIDDYISNDNIIQIYPNPVNTGELFTLITNIAVNDLRDSKILLYNTIGNLVSGFSMTNSMMNLFAPNQKGHYIVKIVTKNGSQSTKLIVK